MNDEELFTSEHISIFLVKQSTREASSAKWERFGNNIRFTTNDVIFTKPLNDIVLPLQGTKQLILSDKRMVAYSDVKCILHTQGMDSIDTVLQSIEKFTFETDYELPLNSRFKQTFMHIMAENGFVVVEIVPQDSATIYRKSQPDLVMFKSNSQFMKKKSITAATIETGEIL